MTTPSHRFRPAAAALAGLVILAGWPAAMARPLDGTDTNVQPAGLSQLELGVADLRGAGRRTLAAPVAVLTYGVADGSEVAFAGQFSHALGPLDAGQHRLSMGGTGISFKHQFTAAAAPGEAGSAAGCGLLLPEAGGDSGTGASCSAIVSQLFAAGAAHLNLTATRSRAQAWSHVLGLIVEGRDGVLGGAVLRPVMEVWWQRAHDGAGDASARSLLAGVVWKHSEQLAFDAAVRRERGSGGGYTELRAGLTWLYSSRP
jgi:hypothetical protein